MMKDSKKQHLLLLENRKWMKIAIFFSNVGVSGKVGKGGIDPIR